MPEQPYIITARRFEEFKRQIQQLLDDLYNERIAGAQVGDVFSINALNDVLTLKLASLSGLQKSTDGLSILANPAGCIQIGTGGVDVYQVTTSKKGACPILSDDDTEYLDGKGNWSTPVVGVTQDITVVTDVGPPVVTATLHFVNGLLASVT